MNEYIKNIYIPDRWAPLSVQVLCSHKWNFVRGTIAGVCFPKSISTSGFLYILNSSGVSTYFVR